jgi:4-amino-4-deoxy-L-arabinose transferase-like glycosyltransferase
MTTTEIAPGADYWPGEPGQTPIAPPPPVPAEAVNRPPWRRFSNQTLGLAALLIGTALLYLVNLSVSGLGNEYYAAAVQAGTKSWKAFFFGSFDSSNFITVDKPPAFLWPMEIAGRIFGFNSWSMLVPQALMGIGSVWLLFLTVRRWFGPAAGFIAGAALALTPVAVLMFRFNDPDAMMTFLMVLAAYFVTRALEEARTKWMVLTGLTMGFAFLAKGLQPFTLVPALALVYLICAPTGLFRRIWQTLLAGAALIAGCGWWLAIVALTPAADRPYIGGSTNNSALELAFGYNGLGRITGNEVAGATGGAGAGGGGGGGGGGASFSGSTGIGRLFNSLMGGQISWLLPAALLGLVALVVIAGRAARTDRVRAAAILWGGWLLVTGAVLSFASGIIHTYYTVELAPAIAALVGIAAVTLWRHRSDITARLGLAVGVLVTGTWSYELLDRTPDWHPWVRALVLIATVVAALALIVPARWLTRATAIALIAATVAVGGGATAYAVSTASAAHSGGTPSAGPSASSGGGPGGVGGGAGGRGGFGGGQGGPGGGSSSNSTGSGSAGSSGPAGGFGGPGGGNSSQSGSVGSTGQSGQSAPSGSSATEAGGVGGAGGASAGGAGGGAGGNQTASSALTALLKATTTKWAAATVGAQSAEAVELASGKAVMALGGFSGTDNSISLAAFEKLVESGQIHYFIGGGNAGGPGGGGSNANSAISSWVAAHYSSTTVGGTTVYDLTKATS